MILKTALNITGVEQKMTKNKVFLRHYILLFLIYLGIEKTIFVMNRKVTIADWLNMTLDY